MARVKCITMQRDESTLLESWLRYHGYLFGFENLLVFDNGSRSPRVTETLLTYERLGVEIRRDQSTREDWYSKAIHFRNIIQHWDNLGDYDFVLPMDCDEFLALFADGSIRCQRAAIHAAFDAIGRTDRSLGIATSLNNVPQRPGWFWPEHRPKAFLAAGSGAEVDFDNREVATEAGGEQVETDFLYLHHRYRPLEEQRLHECNKLGIEAEPTPLEALRRHADPEVAALAQTLAGEKQYEAQFDDRLLIQVPEFSLLLEALGIHEPSLVDHSLEPRPASSLLRLPRKLPKRRSRPPEEKVSFDGDYYRALHPDIAASGAIALKHFLVYGHAEGREI